MCSAVITIITTPFWHPIKMFLMALRRHWFRLQREAERHEGRRERGSSRRRLPAQTNWAGWVNSPTEIYAGWCEHVGARLAAFECLPLLWSCSMDFGSADNDVHIQLSLPFSLPLPSRFLGSDTESWEEGTSLSIPVSFCGFRVIHY